MEYFKNSPVNNSLISTFLCTYCEIWMIIASTYFCIFVLLFQNNIKFNIYHNVSSFFFFFLNGKNSWFLATKWALQTASQLHLNSTLAQHSSFNISSAIHYRRFNNNTRTILLCNCVWYIFDNIWIFLNCVKVLIIASFSQMKSCLHPEGNWTAFHSHWGFTVVSHAPAASQALTLCVRRLDLLSCACSGRDASLTGLVWEAMESQHQAGWLFSSGVSLCSRLGGRGPGMEGKGMEERSLGTDSLSCVKYLPCFSVFLFPSESCLPPCSGIWFNFSELFIFLSKYPLLHWEWN